MGRRSRTVRATECECRGRQNTRLGHPATTTVLSTAPTDVLSSTTTPGFDCRPILASAEKKCKQTQFYLMGID